VQNLFLCGEGPAKPNAQLRPLLRLLTLLQADLLVLQELGSLASLEQLIGRLEAPYSHLGLLPGNSDRCIHLGVLSRYPVSLVSHRDTTLLDHSGAVLREYADEAAARAGCLTQLKFSRDLLRVDLLGSDPPLSVFVVHLKSRTNRQWRMLAADAVRAAECRAITRIVQTFQRAHPATLVALCGDFNDLVGSDALAPLAPLQLCDPLGDSLRLRGRNPSTYWPKRRMRLDHLLLCQEAAAYLVPGSPTIHASRMAQTASDHFPVSLALQIAPRDCAIMAAQT